MMKAVHPTAVIADGARLGAGVEVGPYSVIGPHALLGDGTRVLSHAVIEGPITLGPRCVVYPGACLGFEAQDKKLGGTPGTRVEIGADNVFREHATVHRATTAGAATVIGDRNYFMAGSHVGHDSRVGNDVVMANSAALGGHALVEDGAIVGGLVGVHQFCRIGARSMVGGCSKVHLDVPPYTLVFGSPAKLYGANVVGLRRSGVPRESIDRIRRAIALLFASGLSLSNSLPRARAEFAGDPYVETILRFAATSKRGLLRRAVTDETVE